MRSATDCWIAAAVSAVAMAPLRVARRDEMIDESDSGAEDDPPAPSLNRTSSASMMTSLPLALAVARDEGGCV